MPATAVKPERLAELRSRAASRLTGAAATKGTPARAADALAVLHALASSPDTASDALALLHELQVHQVELDLQAQELDESRSELEAALRRQIELYEGLPVGCLTLDARLAMHEMNRAAAAMLGVERDAVYGLGLDAFVCADSALRLRSAVAGLEADGQAPTATCRVRLGQNGAAGRMVLASIGRDSSAHRYLVTLTDGDEDPARPRPGA